MTLILGHNINTTHGFFSLADYAKKTESNVFQIFLRSPHKYNDKRKSMNEIKKLGDHAKELGIAILVHGSLILNFCHKKGSRIGELSIKTLIDDLNDSVLLNAIGVVIHMGHNTITSKDGGKNNKKDSVKEATKNYVENIQWVLKKTHKNSIIIFETGAGQGSEVCTSLIDLGDMYNMFTDEEKKRIKFCIDTCHVFSAGYDIGNPEYVNVFCTHVDITLGWENVAAIHLNDSVGKLNCHRDRHADIGKGAINIKGMMEFIKVCKKKSIPMILETPGDIYSHHEQIKYIQTLL